MKIKWILPLCCLTFSALLPCFALAQEAEQPPQANVRSKMLMVAAPVGVNIGGGTTLPEGVLLTALNTSFAEKTHPIRNGDKASDVFSQAWLLKIRYGFTDNLEILTVASYVNLERTDPTGNPKHLEGYGDQMIGFTYAFKNLRQKDPFAVALNAMIALPTAPEGKNHIPGASVWGAKVGLGYTQFLNKDIKFETEVNWSGTFQRGNQDVKRGDAIQWNSHIRYLFDSFDLGLESMVTHQESGTKHLSAINQNKNIANGFTEWYMGPSVNIPIDRYDMWVGAGMFFPVTRHFDGPGRGENFRVEFKIGKLW